MYEGSLYVQNVYLFIYLLSVIRSFIFFNIKYEFIITLSLCVPRRQTLFQATPFIVTLLWFTYKLLFSKLSNMSCSILPTSMSDIRGLYHVVNSVSLIQLKLNTYSYLYSEPLYYQAQNEIVLLIL